MSPTLQTQLESICFKFIRPISIFYGVLRTLRIELIKAYLNNDTLEIILLQVKVPQQMLQGLTIADVVMHCKWHCNQVSLVLPGMETTADEPPLQAMHV